MAAETGVPARTIRFYISRGLVPGPRGGGRAAAYGPEHLERLEKIRRLQARGLMLVEIARVLGGERVREGLAAPAAWWNYTLDEDVMVWVRADASPWRLRQVRRALQEMAARLRAAAKEENDHAGDH